jgi:ABC-type glycerol-3-phosphate transport system permease component
LASADQNYPMLLAAVVMSIIPVVILFAVFQKHFINIDISGGLKG